MLLVELLCEPLLLKHFLPNKFTQESQEYIFYLQENTLLTAYFLVLFSLTASITVLEEELTISPSLCVSGPFPAQVLDLY